METQFKSRILNTKIIPLTSRKKDLTIFSSESQRIKTADADGKSWVTPITAASTPRAKFTFNIIENAFNQLRDLYNKDEINEALKKLQNSD